MRAALSATAMMFHNPGYAPANGLKIYHEIYGTGILMILLPGGVGISMFGSNLSALSGKRKLIAVELQSR